SPDLARSLRRIADGGPSGFYEGATADAMLAVSREKNGTLAADDLRDFEPEWVVPMSTTYRGWDVYELPPNTQGIAALLMLNLMEQFPFAEYGFHTAQSLHVMIEAKKLAYADMLRYVGDTRFNPASLQPLLDKAAAKQRARAIDMTRAAVDVRPSVLAGLTTSVGAGTGYFCAIDRDGNIAPGIERRHQGVGCS